MKKFTITVRPHGQPATEATAICASMSDAWCVALTLLGEGVQGSIKVKK